MTISPFLLQELMGVQIQKPEAVVLMDSQTTYPTQTLSDALKSYLIRQVSYSGLGGFRDCERRYYLDKLSLGRGDSSADTAFGHAVGAGIQALWRFNGDIDKAAAACFFAWSTDFAAEKDSSKKSIGYALKAIEKYLPFYNILSQEWELAEINGVPAIEFSLVLEFPDGFRYRSFVDLILRNKISGEVQVHEVKTTGAKYEHEAMYGNSDQGLSYNVIVDLVTPGKNSFWVDYWTYFTTKQEWVNFPFAKTRLDKARWLQTTLRDLADIARCEREDYWPTRGKSCMNYGRPCQYYGVCKLPDRHITSSPELLAEKAAKEQKKGYSFVVKVEDVLREYLEVTGELA